MRQNRKERLGGNVNKVSRILLVFLGWVALSVAYADDIPIEELKNLQAQASAERGKTKTTTCVACHGLDGKGITPDIPNIGGQYETFLLEELLEYKEAASGVPGQGRANPIMSGMVASLSDEDLADLAAYYAEQPVAVGQADPELVAWGERVYRGGIVSEEVPACIGCHGPQGEGNELANFPKLSGQNATYLASQLKAFKEGTRGGGTNDIMHSVVHHMTTEDMEAVASYIQGLH